MISRQQNRYISVAKELLCTIKRLLSCCYYEKITLPLPTDPFDERFRLTSDDCGFDAESSRCPQKLCFILKGVGTFQCFLRSIPGYWLLTHSDNSLLSRAWRNCNQNEYGLTRLCQVCCLLQSLFSTSAVIE